MNIKAILTAIREFRQEWEGSTNTLIVDISSSVDYGSTAPEDYISDATARERYDSDPWSAAEEYNQLFIKRYLITGRIGLSDPMLAGASVDPDTGAIPTRNPFCAVALGGWDLIVEIKNNDRGEPMQASVLFCGFGVMVRFCDLSHSTRDIAQIRNTLISLIPDLASIATSTNGPRSGYIMRNTHERPIVTIPSHYVGRDRVVIVNESTHAVRLRQRIELSAHDTLYASAQYVGPSRNQVVISAVRAAGGLSEIEMRLAVNGAGFVFRPRRFNASPRDLMESERSARRTRIRNGYCGNCGDRAEGGFSRMYPSIIYGYVCSECNSTEIRNMYNLEEYMNNIRVLDYSTRPTVEFKRVNGNDPYFFGIELEVNASRGVSTSTMAQRIRDALKPALGATWYLKKDSSTVSDSYNGCEIVTTPQSYDSLELLNWRDALNGMKDQKLTAYKSGLCGLHVHISRPSDSITSRMRAFLVSQVGWLVPFSARTQQQLDNFAAFRPDYRRTWSNNYGRYSALNETEHTVELRFFRSTLSYGRFWASIQLSAALPLFAEQHSTATIRDKDKCRAAWDRWLKNQTRYDHLASYLASQEYYRS